MIRLPGHLPSAVVGIRFKDGDSRLSMVRVYHKSDEGMRLVWEANQSTFLDRFGNVFYDKYGVPFQGK